VAVAQRISGAQAFSDPSLPEPDGIGHGESVRERAGDCGRKRVTTAVVIAGNQTLRVELVEIGTFSRATVEQVATALR
jgi:hypothetical protein